ncbi:anti-sigma factor [uncultured Pseudokineococcus sp.]|uniref:anti-sigma factor n=1 Tax=uncultured Pseudokineococcus sp. TaxID=1642928 RepID=UPI002617D293|nr:anti-sigma factor [uncultured Pseudokineococcus sp.]
MTIIPPSGARRSGEDPGTRDLLAAYALDAVDDVERARVERLLRTDADAAAEHVTFAETASRLAVAAAAPAPTALRARVLDEVSRTRQAAPAAASGGPARHQRPASRGAVRLLAAACGVLLAGCIGLGALVLGGEDARPALVAAGDFAGGTAALLEVDGEYVVVGEGVPEPAEDRVYQLWSVEGSADPVPAGFLEQGPDGSFVGEVGDWEPGAVLGISEEPVGGSEQPTSEVLAHVET